MSFQIQTTEDELKKHYKSFNINIGSHHIKTHFLKCFYERTDISVLLALHGMGSKNDRWVRFMQAMSRNHGRTSFVPSLPGAGLTGLNNQTLEYDLDLFKDWLKDCIGYFTKRQYKPVIIAHSMSGIIPVKLILSCRALADVIKGVIFYDPSGFDSSEVPFKAKLLSYKLAARSLQSLSRLAKFYPESQRRFFDGFEGRFAEIHNTLKHAIKNHSQLASNYVISLRELLQLSEALPVYFILSDNSPFQESREKIIDLVGGYSYLKPGNLELIEGGHSEQEANPTEFARLVDQLCKRIDYG